MGIKYPAKHELRNNPELRELFSSMALPMTEEDWNRVEQVEENIREKWKEHEPRKNILS